MERGEEDEAQDAVGARKIHANRAAISNTCWMCANIYTDCSTYRYISLSLSLPVSLSLERNPKMLIRDQQQQKSK